MHAVTLPPKCLSRGGGVYQHVALDVGATFCDELLPMMCALRWHTFHGTDSPGRRTCPKSADPENVQRPRQLAHAATRRKAHKQQPQHLHLQASVPDFGANVFLACAAQPGDIATLQVPHLPFNPLAQPG
jgi:hypothetical protein